MIYPSTRAEAIEKGVNKYFTNHPCTNGHLAARYTTSGTCAGCIRDSRSAIGKKITQRFAAAKGDLSYMQAAHIRVSPENYAQVRDLALNLSIIRNPAIELPDVQRRPSGRDSQGGYLLYTLWMHPQDAEIVRAHAASLITNGVDIAAERRRIFGNVERMADQAAEPEPEFRP